MHMIISPLLCGVSSIKGTLLCDADPPCRIVVHTVPEDEGKHSYMQFLKTYV